MVAYKTMITVVGNCIKFYKIYCLLRVFILQGVVNCIVSRYLAILSEVYRNGLTEICVRACLNRKPMQNDLSRETWAVAHDM